MEKDTGMDTYLKELKEGKMQIDLKKILVLIVCIIANVLGRRVTAALSLPLWLDCIGTFGAVRYLGTGWGIGAAVIGTLFFSIGNPSGLSYLLVSLVMALCCGYFKKGGMFKSISQSAMYGFWLSLLSVVLSTPINLLVMKGYAGNVWSDTTVDLLKWYGLPLWVCSLAGELTVDFFDKQACIVILWIFDWCRRKVTSRRSGTILGGLALLVSTLAFTVVPVQAADTRPTIYNRENGLLSSEANTVAETPDGLIWIGSYAGLVKYDGRDFTFIQEGGIANVNVLFTDSAGRLWIGTNDSGLALYDDGKYQFYKEEDGLPSDSIRCFAEGQDGKIYVGTSEEMAVISKDGKVAALRNGLSYVSAVAVCGENIFCSDNAGNLFVLLDKGRIASRITPEKTFINTVETCGNNVLAGDSAGRILAVKFSDKKSSVKLVKKLSIGEIRTIKQDSAGRVWAGGMNSFGYLGKKGKFHDCAVSGFQTTIYDIHEDYQGNMWVASGDNGVLKLAECAFSELLPSLSDKVVNAILSYQGSWYIGADDGLYLMDAQEKRQENELTETLSGVRVRCLYEDSRGYLWVCSYDKGLIQTDGRKILSAYTMDSAEVTNDRFRCIIELSDGSLAAGTSDGLNFIKNGKIIGRLTGEDGLSNTQILSLAQEEDGSLLVGTDGAGVYRVKNDKIVGHIGKNQGLASEIIMKLDAYEGGFFAVTSNSLAYIKGDKVQVLNNFPYFNNFDVMLSDDGGTAYVLSSSGIFVLSARELLENSKTMAYRFYGTRDGLSKALCANSYSCFDKDGRLLLTTSSGLAAFDTGYTVSGNVKYGLSEVTAGNKPVSPDKAGNYQIPADAARVKLVPSVRNFSQKNIYVKVWVEGFSEETESVAFDELEPLILTNLASGTYKVGMELSDGPGGTSKVSQSWTIVKEPHSWEHFYYMFYLILVSVGIIVYTTWTVLRLFQNARRKAELAQMSQELERKVAEQTQVIREREEQTKQLLMETVEALTNTIDAKDTYTSGHSRRVAKYSRMLAKKLGKSREAQNLIYQAGLLHDVGKIRIPESVINKPGRLTDEEFAQMKLHPVAGFRIINGISWDKKICYGARFHHERYDGHGYPDGRAGEDIPEIARIIGVADAYDAMASNRSYRKAIPQATIREELVKGRGKQFDPVVADAMIELIDSDKDYKLRQKDPHKKKVLVVDDSPLVAITVSNILADFADVSVKSVASRQEAIEAVGEEKYNLILLDIWLQDDNGLDVMRELRGKYDVPIFIMSSDLDLPLFEQAVEGSASDFLVKPIVPAVLREMTEGILYV